MLPGVNVEASSPVLIEKVRTGISDSTGLYRIPDLPPGTYKVTFTLPGFATVSREGVEVTGSGVTTINADMRGGVPVGNFTYRGWASAGSNEQFHNVWRASGTYVTGAHSLKIGYQAAFQVQKNFQNAGSQISYVFNNRTPIQFTLRDAPFCRAIAHASTPSTSKISGHADDSRCKAPCATSTRGAGSPRARTASSPTTSSARSIYSRSRTA